MVQDPDRGQKGRLESILGKAKDTASERLQRGVDPPSKFPEMPRRPPHTGHKALRAAFIGRVVSSHDTGEAACPAEALVGAWQSPSWTLLCLRAAACQGFSPCPQAILVYVSSTYNAAGKAAWEACLCAGGARAGWGARAGSALAQ
jgi:hypothetical protein